MRHFIGTSTFHRATGSGALAIAAACLTGLFGGSARADSISVVNPNFATDTTGWTTWFEVGIAGQNSAANPGGSSEIFYSVGGGTANASAPSGTAGQFTMDAGDVAPPPGDPTTWSTLYPNSNITLFNGNTDARITSVGGALGSFYQDTGVQFLANTTYTLSAYAGGDTTGFSNTGVGLSGGSNLTLAEVNADPDQVNLGQTGATSLLQRTVTIDTALPEFSSLLGQDVFVNLLSNANSFFGRQQEFSGVVLTTTSDVPEPAALSLLSIGAAGLLARRRRS